VVMSLGQMSDLLEPGVCNVPSYKSTQRSDLMEAGAC
jgi:hypothetical protein